MNLRKLIGKLLTFDLTGRTWTHKAEHPYFENLLYFGARKAEDRYWEAELPLPDGSGRIGVTMTGTPEGPTPEEEAFCRKALADLDALFERCRSAFEPEYVNWTKTALPENWRETMSLDGFQVPRNGDESEDWELCYFVEPANHWFTAVFKDGRVTMVSVDG